MAYFDHGYMMMVLTDVMTDPQNAEVIKRLGMSDQINESLHVLQSMRPIDFALDMLTSLIMVGVMLGVPVSAVVQRRSGKVKR